MLKLGAVRQAVVVNDTGYAKNAHVRTFRVQIFRRFVPWNALDVWVRYQQIDAVFLNGFDGRSQIAGGNYNVPSLLQYFLKDGPDQGCGTQQ
jgi:hypothetical protein